MLLASKVNIAEKQMKYDHSESFVNMFTMAVSHWWYLLIQIGCI